jgi:hypothetical protein
MNLSVGQLVRIKKGGTFDGHMDLFIAHNDDTYLVLELRENVDSPFGKSDKRINKKYLYMKLFSIPKNKCFNYFLPVHILAAHNNMITDFEVVADA